MFRLCPGFNQWISIGLMVLLFSGASAQDIYYPKSTGPRAVGMGGASVAVADDAGALFINPAGLVRIGSQQFMISGGGIHFETTGDPSPISYPVNSRYWKRIKDDLSPDFFSIASPAITGHFSGAFAFGLSQPMILHEDLTQSFSKEGSVQSLTVGGGSILSSHLSAGVSLHLLYGIHREYLDSRRIYSGTLYGAYFTLGLLYHSTRNISYWPKTYGLTIDTPFIIRENDGSRTSLIEIPWMLAVGAKWKPVEKMLFALDYRLGFYRGKKIYELSQIHPDYSYVPIPAYNPLAYDFSHFLSQTNSNTHAVHLGGEYVLERRTFLLPLRCGIGIRRTLYGNWDTQREEYYTPVYAWNLGIGVGLAWDKMKLDVAYQYERSARNEVYYELTASRQRLDLAITIFTGKQTARE